MHLFAVDLSSAVASLSSCLGSGSSSRTESQVLVDDVDIDAFSSRMRSNLVTNCFPKKKDYYFSAVINKRTPCLQKQQ